MPDERTTKCSACSVIIDQGDAWPDAARGVLCQDCWELDCDRAWWAMIKAMEVSIWPDK
jgi:hypothetical protein